MWILLEKNRVDDISPYKYDTPTMNRISRSYIVFEMFRVRFLTRISVVVNQVFRGFS
jgi:hypothetical protein